MKLYTEEQVKDMLELTNLNVQFHIDTMIPIELPSDKKIDTIAEKTLGVSMNGFRLGAKWMKEQILNQNK